MKHKIQVSKKTKTFFWIGILIAIAYEIIWTLSAVANWPPENFGIFIDHLTILFFEVAMAICIGLCLETKKVNPKDEPNNKQGNR